MTCSIMNMFTVTTGTSNMCKRRKIYFIMSILFLRCTYLSLEEYLHSNPSHFSFPFDDNLHQELQIHQQMQLFLVLEDLIGHEKRFKELYQFIITFKYGVMMPKERIVLKCDNFKGWEIYE